MFPANYFAPRYFPATYWTKLGSPTALAVRLNELEFFSKVFPDSDRQITSTFWRWLEDQFSIIQDESEEHNQVVGVFTTPSGLGNTTDEKVLATITVPKGIFRADPRQHILRVTAFGTCKENTHDKVIRLTIGDLDIIASPSITNAATNAWKIVADIIAVEEDEQLVHASVFARAANDNVVMSTNLNFFINDVDIKILAKTDTATASEFILRGMTVELMRKVLQ